MNSLHEIATRTRGETEEESAHAHIIPGEQRMWLAVLNQAITDATFGDRALEGYSFRNQLEIRSARRAARTFLCKRSSDLDLVCDGAGINPDKLLEQARELRAKGWQ